MKKKLQFRDLTLEMKKDIFIQIINYVELPSETAKKYNITEKTLNRIVQELLFEEIKGTDDGTIDITPNRELDIL